MKPVISLSVLLLAAITSCGQTPEFAINKNGLIYPEYTVKKLKHIVDSLNLKFKQCALHTTYYSLPQARAHYIRLDKGHIEHAIRDMASGIAFDSLVRKYKPAIVKKDRLVIKSQYKNAKEQDVLHFSTISMADDDRRYYEVTVTKYVRQYSNPKKYTWVMEHAPKTQYSNEWVDALFLLEDFRSSPMNPAFARLVQYADCLVDTTTGIFLQGKKIPNPFSRRVVLTESTSKLIDYVNKLTDRPKMGDDYDAYLKKARVWDSLRFYIIDEQLKKDTIFLSLLRNAMMEAEETGYSSDELEDYISYYISPKKALQLKRSRVVVGMCSQDDSPRTHALNIAKLSAEAIAWEVFLRAHLDIMNDRFERVSDGSYAWAGRQTYIKELEVLEINVPDLLLGINLRISNPSVNHYFGSINRTGRALAESKDLDLVEVKLLNLVRSNELDVYNRLLMYYLFLNYNHHLTDEARKAKNVKDLNKAVMSLPAYLTAGLKHIKTESKN